MHATHTVPFASLLISANLRQRLMIHSIWNGIHKIYSPNHSYNIRLTVYIEQEWSLFAHALLATLTQSCWLERLNYWNSLRERPEQMTAFHLNLQKCWKTRSFTKKTGETEIPGLGTLGIYMCVFVYVYLYTHICIYICIYTHPRVS